MNHIYRVVWSRARGCYVVASEFARRHTKGGQLKKLLAAFFAAGLLLGAGGMAAAADSLGVEIDNEQANIIAGEVERIEISNTSYSELFESFGGTTTNPSGTRVSNYNLILGGQPGTNQTTYVYAGHSNLVASSGSKIAGDRNIVVGYNHKVGVYDTSEDPTKKASGNLVIGNQNTVETQYNIVSGKNNTVLRGEESIDGYNTVSGTNNTINAGSQASSAIGQQIEVTGKGASGIGQYITVDGTGAFAAGSGTKAQRLSATGTGAVALGYRTVASGTGAFAAGGSGTDESQTRATGTGAVALGYESVAEGTGAFATAGGQASADYATAIGTNAKSNIANAVAIGADSLTTRKKGEDGYLKGSNSGNEWTATHEALAVGNDKTVTRQITGLAAGSSDTDAVNVAQLKVVNNKSIKSGSLSDGTLTLSREDGDSITVSGFVTEDDLANQKLTYKNNGTNARQVKLSDGLNFADGENTTVTTSDNGLVQVNVSKSNIQDIAKETVTVSAGKNIDVSGTDGKYSVSLKDNVTLGTDQANRINIDGENGSITVGSATNSVKVSKDGIGAGGKKITNVADGSVADGSTDAVNGSQLYNVKQEIENKQLTFAGDTGSTAKKLGETVSVQGGVTDTANLTDGNVGVVVSEADGVIRVKLAKKLSGLESVSADTVTANTVTSTTVSATNMYVEKVGDAGTSVVNKDYLTSEISRVDSRHTTVTTDGNLTLKKTEATDTAGANYEVGLGDAVTLGSADADGSLTIKNQNGKSASVTVNGSGAAPAGSTSSVTRLEYKDESNTTRQVATMDDGIAFRGDDGKTVTRKLGQTLDIRGDADLAAGTADKNVAVVSDADGVIRVKLSKKLSGLDSVSATNMYVEKVGDAGTSVVNKDYVTNQIAGADSRHTTVTTDGNLTAASSVNENGGTNYNISLNDTVTVGSEDGKKITLDGTAGNISVGGVTVGTQVVKETGANGAEKSVSGNYVTGLTNTTWDGNTISSGRAATEDQLKKATEQMGETLAGTTFGLRTEEDANGNVSGTATQKVDNTVLVKGTNGIIAKASGENGEAALELSLGNNITIGTPGKDGKDGEIGLAGKDGVTTIKTEYISGKDGKDGIPGLDGKDGVDGITRVVYTDPKTGEKETVATLKDGLYFKGDDGKSIAKTLNTTLEVKGGAKTDNLSENNIGVVANEDGSLGVKLSKDVTGLTKVEATNMYVTNVDESSGDSVTNKTYVDKTVAASAWKLTTNGTKDGVSAEEISQNDTVDFSGANGVKVSRDGADVTVGLDKTVHVGGTDDGNGNISGGVTIGAFSETDAATGTTKDNYYVTGLTNKDWDGENIVSGRAATEDQLQKATEQMKGDLADTNFGLADDNGKTVTRKVNDTVTVKGDGSIKTTVKTGEDGDYLEVGLTNKLTIGKENGADGKDGENGSVTIIKQDGTKGEITVVNGKDGVNGTPGLPGTDGKDGITRIEYTDKDGGKHDVATLEDGLAFAGDDGKVISKKLNETLSVTGGAKTDNLTDGNIGVVADENGGLSVKLSKDVTGLNKVEATNMYVTNVDESSGDSVTNKTYVDKTVAASAWKLSANGKTDEASDVKQGTVVDFSGTNGIEISKDGTNIKAGIGKTLTTAGGVTVGEQKIVMSSGKDDDGNNAEISQTGNYVTGLDNTEWKENSVVEDRAATEGQLRDVSKSLGDTINKGLNFAGDTGTVNKKLGDVVNIKGDENITTAVDENGDILVKLNKEITVETVNANTFKAGDNVTLDGDGLTIGGGEGTSPITIKQGNVSFGGNVIHNVGEGTEDSDAATIGQLNKAITDAKNSDRHLEAGSYAVKDFTDADGNKTGQGVSIAIVDNTGSKVGADGKEYGSVTITDMAKASDLGEVSALDKDLLNVKKDGDGNIVTDENGAPVTDKTTAVDAINNLNKKVGDLKYSEVEGTDITDGDSTTDAIGKLDNRMDNMDKTIDGLSKNHTEVKAGNGIKVTDENENADGVSGKHVYKVELTPEVTLGEAADAEAGTEGTDGKLTVMGKDGNAVTVDGASGTISGLTNTGWDANNADSYKGSTKAATESQLQQAMAGAVQYDRNEDGTVNTTKVTLADNDGAGTTITNVAAGKVEKGSMDAVNGGQLYEMNQAVINNSQNITNLGNAVNKLDDRVKRVGAGAAALAALQPLDFDPDAKWDFAAGFGSYRSANAAAVGAYYRPNEDVMVSIGGSMGGGENMFNAGVSLKLGAGHSNVSTSKVAMAKEIKNLREDLEELRSAVFDMNSGRTLDLSKLAMFPDIPENHWAYEYIAVLAGNGIIEGYPDGNFGGDRQMTRYEFATLLCRAMLKGAKLSDRILQEFAPELEYFKVITVERDDNGNPIIRRVRTIRENEMK